MAEPLPITLALRALRPPLRDRRFWLVQLLVIAIALGHEAADMDNFLKPIGVPSFVTVSFFLVPIVYAALNFGLTGSFATAVWVTLLTLPDFAVIDQTEHHWVDGLQLAVIDAVAIFVGQRVERERLARQRSEEAGEAYRKAEARYRALFTSSSAPIFVVEPDGSVRESNPAAQALLGDGPAGRPIGDLLPVSYRALCDHAVDVIRLAGPDGDVRDLRPYCTAIETEEGQMVQVLLQDVTEERRERERMTAYAAHVVQAQEEERRRIGQELHDEPLQALIQLYRQLADGRHGGTEARLRELDDAGGLLDRTIRDLQQLAHGLRPPILDDLGVVSALRRATEDFGDRNALEVRFQVAGQVRRLEAPLELSVFRIAQEALRNVERHAAARNVSLRLDFRPNRVRVEVEDDGIGFQAEELQASTRSLGLLGMKERAHLLGGGLVIESRPGAGTLVRVELPTADE